MPGAQGVAVIDHREGAARAAYRADWVAVPAGAASGVSSPRAAANRRPAFVLLHG